MLNESNYLTEAEALIQPGRIWGSLDTQELTTSAIMQELIDIKQELANLKELNNTTKPVQFT